MPRRHSNGRRTATRNARSSRNSARGRSLGLGADPVDQIVCKIRDGFPFATIDRFRRFSQLSLESIADAAQIPSRTLSRRRSQGRLAPDESERLLRISTVFEQAVDLFVGNVPAAAQWLRAPQPALGNQRPLELARTEIGAREVEDLIGRLLHGVFP